MRGLDSDPSVGTAAWVPLRAPRDRFQESVGLELLTGWREFYICTLDHTDRIDPSSFRNVSEK